MGDTPGTTYRKKYFILHPYPVSCIFMAFYFLLLTPSKKYSHEKEFYFLIEHVHS